VLPRLACNPETGAPMSKKTIYGIYETRCFDEKEEDPWCFMKSPAQDYLTSTLKPFRVVCAKWILAHTSTTSWTSHVAIDPCSSLVPKTQWRLEEQKVAALGSSKWMSKGSSRKGSNLRAPATAKKQGGNTVIQIHWTPIFARDKLRVYICDPDLAARDSRYPSKLNDSENLAKFIRNVLPGILAEMKGTYRWQTLPRRVVHDKASYMVNNYHQRLHVVFATALQDAGFTSWIGDNDGSAKWLVAKWGDVYLHETVISHIRRLLEHKFRSDKLAETHVHFGRRMQKVVRHMNSADFARDAAGGGLPSLARDLRARCEQVILLKGERLPH
jgi:hypothetical protein